MLDQFRRACAHTRTHTRAHTHTHTRARTHTLRHDLLGRHDPMLYALEIYLESDDGGYACARLVSLVSAAGVGIDVGGGVGARTRMQRATTCCDAVHPVATR